MRRCKLCFHNRLVRLHAMRVAAATSIVGKSRLTYAAPGDIIGGVGMHRSLQSICSNEPNRRREAQVTISMTIGGKSSTTMIRRRRQVHFPPRFATIFSLTTTLLWCNL